MREVRIVLLTKIEDSQTIRDRWQEAVNKRGKLDLSHCHTQTVGDRYTICRWEWTPLSDSDKFDFVNLCEAAGVGYEFILIGKEALDDVEDFICHSRLRLPVHLEPHITVNLMEGEWTNPIEGINKTADQDRDWFERQK